MRNNGQSAVATKEYGVLETHGTQTQVPTASTAKLITVLAVLESKRLRTGETGPKITITAKDTAILQKYVAQDGSVVQLAEGTQLTQYEMIQGILLASANNLADSLAIWAFGSLENYTNYANQMIEAYGLTNTVVGIDASGLSPTTKSTAHDLALLGRKALQHPVIAEITKQQQATLPGAGVIRNTNRYAGTNGIVGLKTGNTDEAGGVFILASEHALGSQKQVTIITVVMGAENIKKAIDDSMPLLESAKANLISVSLMKAGDTVASFTMPWETDAKTYSAVTTNTISGPIWKPIAATPKITLDAITAPLEVGSTIGSITFKRADGVELKSEIRLSEPIESPSTLWRVLGSR